MEAPTPLMAISPSSPQIMELPIQLMALSPSIPQIMEAPTPLLPSSPQMLELFSPLRATSSNLLQPREPASAPTSSMQQSTCMLTPLAVALPSSRLSHSFTTAPRSHLFAGLISAPSPSPLPLPQQSRNASSHERWAVREIRCSVHHVWTAVVSPPLPVPIPSPCGGLIVSFPAKSQILPTSFSGCSSSLSVPRVSSFPPSPSAVSFSGRGSSISSLAFGWVGFDPHLFLLRFRLLFLSQHFDTTANLKHPDQVPCRMFQTQTDTFWCMWLYFLLFHTSIASQFCLKNQSKNNLPEWSNFFVFFPFESGNPFHSPLLARGLELKLGLNYGCFFLRSRTELFSRTI